MPDEELEARVSALLDDLDEGDVVAIALGGTEPFTRRGLAAPHYVDAGTGLRGVPGATAFPAGIALAAGFDADLAQRYGVAVGTEARAAGFTVLLGPTLDLARDPRGGRVAEAFGEDPYLTSLIGAAHVRGAQSTRLVAQLKHYVAYNGEEQRTGLGRLDARGDSIDVRVSRATLEDVYLRPFRAAVEAGAWSIMTSHNRINGRYVAEDPELLALPREWGWTGFSCPDFLFAVRDDAAALAAGLDQPALGGPAGRTAEMLASRPDGQVRRLVANVVRVLVGSGAVDDPPHASSSPPSTPEHRELAHAAAVAGAVLLRNQGGALPFGDDVRTLAVVGPAGDDALYVGGGAAAVTLDPARVVSPLRGLRDRAHVVHAQGSLGDVPLPTVPADEFGLPATVRVDGRVVMAGWRELERFIAGPPYPLQGVVDLTAGEAVLVEVDYEAGPAIMIPPEGLVPTLRLGWQPPDGLLDDAVGLAPTADAAVVLVTAAAGEGMDRDGLALPGDQDELVARVAAANPRTVVVLNTPGPVLMPWLDDVAAVLQVWYPGERYGSALASVLFGDEVPGGRLPLTFPHDRGDLPGGDHGPVDRPEHLDYAEGAAIGYRSEGVRRRGALFPFGCGLSYARTECTVDAVEADGTLTLNARNLGGRCTVHVAQVYAGLPGTPERELVAVARLPLAPHGTAHHLLTVPADAFARWDGTARTPVDGRHLLDVTTASDVSGTVVHVDVRGGAVRADVGAGSA